MRRLLATILIALLSLLSGLVHAQFSAAQLVTDARSQIGVTTRYDASYQTLGYPNGDVAISGGVCTDVVIRSLRHQGIDLQQLLHEDMRRNFAEYPKLWQLKRADKNIDHRRVPNLQRYFLRQGWALKLPDSAQARAVDAFVPGDLVTWMLPGNLPHIGIISDQKARLGGQYLVLHNVGQGAQEQDSLTSWPLTGHFRVPSNRAK